MHEKFKSLEIPYVCFIEGNKSFIKHINNYVYIVKPDSAILPETKNYFGEDKIHSNIFKFYSYFLGCQFPLLVCSLSIS